MVILFQVLLVGHVTPTQLYMALMKMVSRHSRI